MTYKIITTTGTPQAGLPLIGAPSVDDENIAGRYTSGLRIIPGDLIKAEPFNDMCLQIEALKIVLADVAASAGLDIDVPAELAKAKKSLQVADELMEENDDHTDTPR